MRILSGFIKQAYPYIHMEKQPKISKITLKMNKAVRLTLANFTTSYKGPEMKTV